MSRPKYAYIMDYIPDKNLYRAVMYARKMMQDGKSAPIAIRRAAHFYDCDMSDVAHYVGQCGGRKSADR